MIKQGSNEDPGSKSLGILSDSFSLLGEWWHGKDYETITDKL